MFRNEIKKVFCRTGSRVALLLMAAVLCIVCYFTAMFFTYANENGEQEYGLGAVREYRAAQKEWAGVLDEAKLRAAIEENLRIEATPEAQSEEVTQNNIAYYWRTGILGIRDLLCCSFAEDFRSYDGYLADHLSPDDAPKFYSNRVDLLKTWLQEQQEYELTEAEKAYIIQKYETQPIPFEYDYMHGWTRLFNYAATVIMISALIIGYLVAGIFSNEFQWRTDSIFFSSRYGRSKAITAKIAAGFTITSVLYWIMMLLFTGFTLAFLGADGANCPVQADISGWKCLFHITNVQKYLLIAFGGYLGNLITAGLAMLVSAGTRSSLLAVTTPFILIFVPSFLQNLDARVVNKILGLLPESLMEIGTLLSTFDTLYTFGSKVVPAVPILFVLHGILLMVLIPVLYHIYHKKQIV